MTAPVTPFQYVLVSDQKDTTTADPGWDVLLTAAVPVLHAGSVLLDFRATVQCEYQSPDSTFLGVAFQFLWDGAPLPESAYVEFDPAIPWPNVDTFAGAVSLRAAVAVAAPGNHTLTLRWQTIADNEHGTIFPNQANLTIEGR